MADQIDMDQHQFFVPMTNHIRPNDDKRTINFPVIDQDTVDRAKQFADNDFTLHCEQITPSTWAFFISDEVAEYDVRIKVLSYQGGEENRKNVSDFIKSDSVEQLLSGREQYLAQENAND